MNRRVAMVAKTAEMAGMATILWGPNDSLALGRVVSKLSSQQRYKQRQPPLPTIILQDKLWRIRHWKFGKRVLIVPTDCDDTREVALRTRKSMPFDSARFTFTFVETTDARNLLFPQTKTFAPL